MADPSEALIDLALMALHHAMDSVVASGGPLVPFAVVHVGDHASVQRFPGDLVEGQERARELIRQSGADRAAVAWDGYLTLDGERTDAVFAEAYEQGDDRSVVMAQRYAVTGRFRKRTEPMGDAALVARNETLL
jgi:hypothetical protein